MVANVDTRRETALLIGSDKVEGTAVYGADQQKIGSVQRIMIDMVVLHGPWSNGPFYLPWGFLSHYFNRRSRPTCPHRPGD